MGIEMQYCKEMVKTKFIPKFADDRVLHEYRISEKEQHFHGSQQNNKMLSILFLCSALRRRNCLQLFKNLSFLKKFAKFHEKHP